MKKIPLRTCLGCLQKKPKSELTRLILSELKGLKVDPTLKDHGRGAYLCGEKGTKIKKSCLDQALQTRAFLRAFRGEVNLESVKELPIETR